MAEKKEEKGKDYADPSKLFKDWDKVEITNTQIFEYTELYPAPLNRMRIIYENPAIGIEALYFWCLTHFRAQGFPIVEKLNDVFSASEQSSLFGQGQARLGVTQDRVFAFLRTIHDMVNSLPQYVRELRAIAERRTLYEKSFEGGEQADEHEKTLKGLYIDLVEGGAKNPQSVIGLSQQVGFVVLPNLFFEMNQSKNESDDAFAKRIKNLKQEYNGSVVDLLQRKLTQYYMWKKSTWEELTKRRTYLLKYLRQYYSTIRLYMKWVKPYIKAVKRLGLDLDRNSRAELVKAFETSLIEIELMGKKLEGGSGTGDETVFNCLLITFQYRTKPAMTFATPDFQHRGPTHTGEAEITWRSYAWTQEEIDAFKKIKDKEDIELLKDMNETLREALTGVEDDLSVFLNQADKEVFPDKKEEEKPKKEPLFAPLVNSIKGINEIASSTIGGFKDVLGAFWPKMKKNPGADVKSRKKAIEKNVKKTAWRFYKIFKIAHRLAAWS